MIFPNSAAFFAIQVKSKFLTKDKVFYDLFPAY